MKKILTSVFIALSITTAAQQKPNVILITVDNLGQSDFSAYGNKVVRTPNVDAWVAEGTKFTQAYSTSRNCTPSRAATLTGRYQQRFGVEYLVGRHNYWFNYDSLEQEKIRLENLPPNPYGATGNAKIRDDINWEEYNKIVQGLPLEEVTLAELLKNNGYKTAIIGKWHLGELEERWPDKQGFDYAYGFHDGGSLHAYEDNPDIVTFRNRTILLDGWVAHRNHGSAIYRNGEKIIEKGYLPFRFVEEANQFIEQNKANPFFLYLPFNTPHYPYQAPKSYVEKYKSEPDSAKRIYYAMLHALDDAIGNLQQQLVKNGLDKNTIIFLASDNGGTEISNNGPFRGTMSAHFEGGVRVPLIIKYPEKVPAGKIYDKQVSLLDIFATAAAVTDTSLEPGKKYDGVNLIPYLNGVNTGIPHPVLYWRNGKETRGLRKGNDKLVIVRDKTYLFDLSSDVSEQNDLSLTNLEKLKELQQELAKWEEQMIEPLWPSLFK